MIDRLEDDGEGRKETEEDGDESYTLTIDVDRTDWPHWLDRLFDAFCRVQVSADISKEWQGLLEDWVEFERLMLFEQMVRFLFMFSRIFLTANLQRLGFDEGETLWAGVTIHTDGKTAGNFRVLCDGQHDPEPETVESEVTRAVSTEREVIAA